MRRNFFWSMMAAAALALLVGGIVAAVLTNRQARRDDLAELSRQAEAIGREAEESIGAARQRGDAALRNLLNERTVRELLFIATRVGGHDFVEIAAVRRGELIVPGTSVLIPALGLETDEFRPGTTVEFEGEVEGQPVVVVVRTVDTGTPAFSASRFEVILSPRDRMASALGPRKMIPSLANRSTKTGSSATKPQPGQTASAPTLRSAFTIPSWSR